jgi:Domain of unknown function (DUF5071)
MLSQRYPATLARNYNTILLRTVRMSSTLSPASLALLPNNKHDLRSVKHLSTLPPSTIAPLIPHLLTWLQDHNWPIYPSMQELVLQHPSLAVEAIRKVLIDADDIEWTLRCLDTIARMPKEQQMALRWEVEGIAKRPNEVEKLEEADVEAQAILDELDGVEDEGHQLLDGCR